MPTPVATVGLTKDLVRDDEVVILMLRPSWLYVVLSSAGGLLFIALMTFALAYMAKFMSQMPGIGWTDRQAFMLGIGLAALRLGWQVLEWVSRVYILTDRRVICRSGVLRGSVFETPLKNIQHVSVFARYRERMFGLGTIGFATSGSHTFQAYWVMIRQPFAVHKTVVQAIQRYGG
ncbi:MAG: PH domain-containing protein [Phycisphaerales bacterium]|nr:PH domain-containing protein [Phycisphaerales bacterium]MCI0631787.1 PH domain-containing protein [Phycisphaerales bacterium]MCI0675103.1 PH domain-containing protein [Phycisphaerales bacterium]